MSRITITGEALVDYVPDAQGARHWTPGGSGLNTALALARLGIVTRFSGSLSQDTDGQRLAEVMRTNSIDLESAYFSNKPCPHVDVSTDAQGSPSYALHLAGTALEDAPSCWAWQGAEHFHATSFASTLGPCGNAALTALKQAHGTITTSFDPNLRPAVFGDRAALPLLLAERIRHADIVKLSHEDLEALAPGVLHDHIIAEWRALGPKLIIVTRGDKGARALFDNHQIEIPARSVIVRDTIGAGDTFMGALLAIMAEERALGAGGFLLDTDRIARWLTFACEAAAFCCTRVGADPPSRTDLTDAR